MTNDNPKHNPRPRTTTRQPDYEFLSVTRRDGVDEWRKEGGAFRHKNGCITTEFAGVRIVLSPIEDAPRAHAVTPPPSPNATMIAGNPELVH